MTRNIILLILSTAFVVLSIACIAEALKRSKTHKKAVYLPTPMVWIGGVCNITFLSIGWAATCSEGVLGLTILFGMFVLLGMSLMLAWKNCYVSYDKKGFTHKNFLGRCRSFSYEEVTAWEMGRGNSMEAHLYVGKKKIPFSMLDKSASGFLIKVFDAYRKSHKGTHIPNRHDFQKNKIGFRAHVHNPGEFLAIFIMVIAFIVGVMIWIAVDGLQPIDENDGQKHVLTFDAWSITDDNFLLHTTQETAPFEISSYQEYLSNVEGLKGNCDSNTVFTLWATYREPDDREPYYDVLSIFSEEEVYLTFEDSTDQARKGAYMVLMLMGGILLLELLTALVIYLVGRNPKKYPKWLVYACFKKSAIDID